MRFTIVAVAVGLLVGLATGGRARNLADRTLRSWPLLVSGLVVQLLSSRFDSAPGLVLLVVSYGLLLGFAVANLWLVGMWLVALGIALNLVVIAVNDGMPVRPSALVAAGVADHDEVHDLTLKGKRHLERPSDRLTGLADVIPVRPLGEVLSFGDVIMSVGVSNVLVHLLRPPRRRRQAPEDGDVTASLTLPPV